MHTPQAIHLSKSMTGKFVIDSPIVIAPLWQEASQGFHGISSIHSIMAMGPFRSCSFEGYAGDLYNSSNEGAPVVFNDCST